MRKVVGIVVHQTGGKNEQSTFGSYSQKGANGTHFLIDKEGGIYQTASLNKRTNHVGMIQSRCYFEKTCHPAEFKQIHQLEHSTSGKRQVTNLEHRKQWPDRYPNNFDSIGVELVGYYDEIKNGNGM